MVLGFPGDVDVSVTYILSGDYELRTEIRAIPLNKSTPISLAQHTYWNLSGHDNGDILGHNICIKANYITPLDKDSIPTGEMLLVDNTPFDFRKPHEIRDQMKHVSGGFDHNFVLKGDMKNEDGLYLAATVKDPKSGRAMDLLTNVPGMQFYTGNFISDTKGKNGSTYKKHSGLCLETQGFPNAVNEPKFPPVVYNPGQVYVHTMLHRFYTDK
jgi:aldose 1-epimerase